MNLTSLIKATQFLELELLPVLDQTSETVTTFLANPDKVKIYKDDNRFLYVCDLGDKQFTINAHIYEHGADIKYGITEVSCFECSNWDSSVEGIAPFRLL